MADWKGVLFRRELDWANSLKDRAILCGSLQVKTPASKSSALLCFVTEADQYFFLLMPFKS